MSDVGPMSAGCGDCHRSGRRCSHAPAPGGRRGPTRNRPLTTPHQHRALRGPTLPAPAAMFRSGGAQPLALLLLLAGMTERVFAAAAAASSKGGPSPPGGWGDHKFTKQGASVNEIYNKLVPFFTQKTDATGEYPPGMVLLFGCAAWIGFMFLMGAWVVRAARPQHPARACTRECTAPFRPPPLPAAVCSLSVVPLGTHGAHGPPAAARTLTGHRLSLSLQAVVLPAQPFHNDDGRRRRRAGAPAGGCEMAQAHQEPLVVAVSSRCQSLSLQLTPRTRRQDGRTSCGHHRLCEHQESVAFRFHR